VRRWCVCLCSDCTSAFECFTCASCARASCQENTLKGRPRLHSHEHEAQRPYRPPTLGTPTHTQPLVSSRDVSVHLENVKNETSQRKQLKFAHMGLLAGRLASLTSAGPPATSEVGVVLMAPRSALS
jgi:hypothetical protein